MFFLSAFCVGLISYFLSSWGFLICSDFHFGGLFGDFFLCFEREKEHEVRWEGGFGRGKGVGRTIIKLYCMKN